MTLTKTIFALAGAAFAVSIALSAPVRAEGPPPKGGMMLMKKSAPKPELLDINSASKNELQALKGVGDKRADDIIKGRPYKGKDDLVAKKILPEGVYNGIKDKIIAKQK